MPRRKLMRKRDSKSSIRFGLPQPPFLRYVPDSPSLILFSISTPSRLVAIAFLASAPDVWRIDCTMAQSVGWSFQAWQTHSRSIQPPIYFAFAISRCTLFHSSRWSVYSCSSFESLPNAIVETLHLQNCRMTNLLVDQYIPRLPQVNRYMDRKRAEGTSLWV